MTRTLHLALAALWLAATPAPAFTEEPLPRPTVAISSAAWDLLQKAEAEEFESEGQWLVRKRFPPELEALDGREFTISGYMIPMEPGEVLTHILLVRDAADCPFCGGGYGAVLEVQLDLGLTALPEFSALTVTGKLRLLRDEDSTQMFWLDAARAQPGG